MAYLKALVITATILTALLLGFGFYTFQYAKGGSYFKKDSKACINCHVMQENYDSWSRSGHRHVTQCNSCHMPTGFIAGYASKGLNGLLHSYAFTTGNHPDPIRIKNFNKNIVINNCIHCHDQIFTANQTHLQTKEMNCLHCHQGVGHYR